MLLTTYFSDILLTNFTTLLTNKTDNINQVLILIYNLIYKLMSELGQYYVFYWLMK